METKTKIYPKGVIAFKPNAKAPSFVKASIVITPDDLIDFINANADLLSKYKDKHQLKLQLLENDKGLYFVVDDYKKNSEDAPF